MSKPLLSKLIFAFTVFIFSFSTLAADMKEWTVLVFLNGHNNLDSFGTLNMNQMKEIGSTKDVNIVVQWASLKNKKTRRIYVEKGNFNVVENLAPIDMGDYRQLIEFARWAHERYPAKKLMIDIWNHGNGWQRVNSRGGFQAQDISYDDTTGHRITTEELGMAMNEIAKLTGQKVELYGSDACLMAMAEVASEMKDSVHYFVGSQEVEPGEGWPYNKFLKPLVDNPMMDGAQLATVLTKEYVKAYSGGIYGNQDVTFSALDLSKLDKFNESVRNVATDLKNLNSEALKAAYDAIDRTQSFAVDEYKDFSDYMTLVGKSANITDTKIDSVKGALSELVVANESTSYYAKSKGISVWLPSSTYSYNYYSQRYKGLEFHKQTGWGEFLEVVLKAKQ